MKTTTFLVVAAILLSFIVEESDGKVTTVLHHGRIRSLQKKRRRTEKKGQPKANQKGGNHTKHAGYRTQKVGYYLKVFCFLLYKNKRIILFKKNLLVVLAYKNRKCTESKTILFYLFRNTPDGTSLQAGWPSDWTSLFSWDASFMRRQTRSQDAVERLVFVFYTYTSPTIHERYHKLIIRF